MRDTTFGRSIDDAGVPGKRARGRATLFGGDLPAEGGLGMGAHPYSDAPELYGPSSLYIMPHL